MQYLIAFLEGIITFISPCLLPMLPIYISYFAGGGMRGSRQTLTNALNVIKLRKAGSHRNERSSFFVTILEIMLDKGEKMCGLFANCD